MNDDLYLDDFDDDDDGLSPALRSQFERLEQSQNLRNQEQASMKSRKLAVRNKIDDWRETRRLRDEIDYLH